MRAGLVGVIIGKLIQSIQLVVSRHYREMFRRQNGTGKCHTHFYRVKVITELTTWKPFRGPDVLYTIVE